MQKKAITSGTGLVPTITYSTEHISGDSYMVTKTTVEMFTIKIPKELTQAMEVLEKAGYTITKN